MRLSLPSFSKRSLVGLDIGSSSIKAIEIGSKGTGKGFELKGLGVSTLPAEAIVQGVFLDSSAIVDGIREAIEVSGIKTREVAAAVAGHSVIVKRVSLPVMPASELEDQIQWEAEQYIPFDVNEVNLDFEILGESDEAGQMDVLLVAAKKDLIDDYVHVIREAGLVPVCVDVAAFAVESAYELNYDADLDQTVALVNVGAEVVNISILKGGVPAFTRDINTGGNQYTEEIQRALAVSSEEAEQIKLGGGTGAAGREVVPEEVDRAIRTVTDTVVGEISRSLDFFGATSSDARIDKVLVSGGAASMAGFDTAFHERTGLPVEPLNPLARMLPASGLDLDHLERIAPSLGVGVGLATRKVAQR
jgi:type IV pilus assembly protein PilM